MKLKEMAGVFEKCWNVPQSVGAIEGIHIPIIAPDKYTSDYFNRNGWHPIVLKAVADKKQG